MNIATATLMLSSNWHKYEKKMETIYFIANNSTAVSQPYFSKENLLSEYDFDPSAGDEIVAVNPGDEGYDELYKMC